MLLRGICRLRKKKTGGKEGEKGKRTGTSSVKKKSFGRGGGKKVRRGGGGYGLSFLSISISRAQGGEISQDSHSSPLLMLLKKLLKGCFLAVETSSVFPP